MVKWSLEHYDEVSTLGDQSVIAYYWFHAGKSKITLDYAGELCLTMSDSWFCSWCIQKQLEKPIICVSVSQPPFLCLVVETEKNRTGWPMDFPAGRYDEGSNCG